MAETMRAVAIYEHGPADVLKLVDWPKPPIGGDEVLIAVHAVGVNPVDFKNRAGSRRPYDKDMFPVLLGWDIAGEVAETNANAVPVGAKVFGMVNFPKPVAGYAEFVASPAAHIAMMPKRLDYIQAAGVPLAALTAWQALFENAGLAAGQRVLIHAAAGGVGHFAVQLAKWKGAHVVATASPSNHDYLRSIGADEVIDYNTTNLTQATGDLDVVLHSLDPETREPSYKVLKKGGLLVAILGDEPTPEETEPYGVRGSRTLVHCDGGQMAEIARLIDEEAVTPNIDMVFPLTEVAEAHRYLEQGHTRGKVVIKVRD